VNQVPFLINKDNSKTPTQTMSININLNKGIKRIKVDNPIKEANRIDLSKEAKRTTLNILTKATQLNLSEMMKFRKNNLLLEQMRTIMTKTTLNNRSKRRAKEVPKFQVFFRTKQEFSIINKSLKKKKLLEDSNYLMMIMYRLRKVMLVEVGSNYLLTNMMIMNRLRRAIMEEEVSIYQRMMSFQTLKDQQIILLLPKRIVNQ